MLDKVKINEKLRIIERERSLLEDFVGMPFEEFVAEDRVHSYYGALHLLQISLQAVLDIGQHINAQKFLESYSKNKDIFGILARRGVISEETKKTFEAAIGARNILVHRYEEVDPKIIHGIIQHNLPDFDKFIDEIGEYLKKEGEVSKNV
jgi:uncharacterized protein YutE (UPF0331/DUF86 family)